MEQEIYESVQKALAILIVDSDSGYNIVDDHNSTIGINALNLIKNKGLAVFRGPDYSYLADITPLGIEVLNYGVSKYFADKKYKDIYIEQLEFDKLRGDVDKLSIELKYIKPAFIISIISTICALISILITLMK